MSINYFSRCILSQDVIITYHGYLSFYLAMRPMQNKTSENVRKLLKQTYHYKDPCDKCNLE